jgi:hypothetical protein
MSPSHPPKSVARQRGSHRGQLRQFDRKSVVPDSVHAIIVPVSRSSDSLGPAVALARQHKCVLLALCSKQASAREVQQHAEWADVDIIAVDMDLVGAVLPSFKSDEMLAESEFARETDVSAKRNLGLIFAWLAGWHRIVFLDDDIIVPEINDLGRVAGLLHHYPAVGLSLAGFPDNSVVCHANRAVGRFQETFIGGGAMAVDVGRMNSFFPNIYNEDWFFLLGGRKSRKYGVVGQANQAAYDPYANPDRARVEEFGDCLAEGLYSLLDTNEFARSAQEVYWEEFLSARHVLIEKIIGSLDIVAEVSAVRNRMYAALSAALDRSREIKPDFCVQYLAAWHADRETWSRFVLRKSHGQGKSGRDAAIRSLGLPPECFGEDRADLDGPVAAVPGFALDQSVSPVAPAEPEVEPSRIDVGPLDGESHKAMAPVLQMVLGATQQHRADAPAAVGAEHL